MLTFPWWQREAADVGKIYKIRIGHDGTGIGDGWFLESVTLKRLSGKAKESDKKKKKKKKPDEEEEEETKAEGMDVYTFVAHRWLAKDEGDKELVVELVPDGESDLEGKYQRERVCACVHPASAWRMITTLHCLAGPFIPHNHPTAPGMHSILPHALVDQARGEKDGG